MTRERAKELLPIIAAYAEGKKIEGRNKGDKEWCYFENWRFDCDDAEYRIKPEPTHVFKPFDRVLVRDYNDQNWICDIYSNKSTDPIDDPFVCIGQNWCECLPYEGNEHLLGTTDSPKDGK